jgi:glycosyltransferase involved in cell wall biosynthesis
MEYMALKKPVVQYDLKEGRFSAQEASLYARGSDTNDFADKIVQLIDNSDLRAKMGAFGYDRVLNELSWDFEKEKLLRFYDRILNNQN